MKIEMSRRLNGSAADETAGSGEVLNGPATLWIGGYAEVRPHPVAIGVRREQNALVWPVS